MAEEGRYRLASVRDARARAERGKREELAAAVGDARASEAELARARSRTEAARHALADAVAARAALASGAATPARLVLAERFIARRRHELDAAVGEELRAEAARDARLGSVDLARRTLARARAEREIVDRHFTRWREARRRLAERRED